MTHHTKLSINEIILDAYMKGDDETIRRLEYVETPTPSRPYVCESAIIDIMEEEE